MSPVFNGSPQILRGEDMNTRKEKNEEGTWEDGGGGVEEIWK